MYYLYRHVRLDKNVPFYIGIGKVREGINIEGYYRAYCKDRTRNNHWKNVINITDYRVDILYEAGTREEICEKEKEFILLYGREDLGTGTLVNFTSGGEMSFNCEKISKRQKENNSNKDGNSFKGKVHTEKSKQLMSEIRKGKMWRPYKNVEQYDLEGNFIKEWTSAKEASESLGIYDKIGAACRGELKTVAGYKWKYKENNN